MARSIFAFAVMAVATACAAYGARSAERPPDVPHGVQAVSLLGKPLYAPPLGEATADVYATRLAEAKSAQARTPDNADSIIWLGRRTAYPGQFREAIEIFTQGIGLHPRDARMYRHRGHRYITIRRFDLAIADLERAAQLVRGTRDEIEPDGLPNSRNIPTSTLQFNIWYHLGLAHYLRADYERALKSYVECMKVSTNPDMLVATSHWMYTTLRHLGREQEAAALLAPISHDMDVIEDKAYHRLLLLYKGELPLDSLISSDPTAGISDVATAYGVAAWHAYSGRQLKADALNRRILDTRQWPAFGYIAAEAKLARNFRSGGIKP